MNLDGGTTQVSVLDLFFAGVKGTDVHMDHHKAPGPDGLFGNLWTDIDLGAGDAVWANNAFGSDVDETYWNIRAKHGIVAPVAKLNNVTVGFTTASPATLNPAKPWLEPLKPAHLMPQNIYVAQFALRGVNAAVIDNGAAKAKAPQRAANGMRLYSVPGLPVGEAVEANGRRMAPLNERRSAAAHPEAP